MIVKEIRQNQKLKLEVVGFVDDDSNKKGQHFQGVPVLGKRGDLSRICLQQSVDEVIIAIPSASGPDIRAIVGLCQSLNVRFKTLPGVGDLIDGKVTVKSIRDVHLEDLLGRKPIHLDNSKIASYINGKRVLVTGAGGSIGSELCRQIAKFQPEKLILFENSETPLFMIDRALARGPLLLEPDGPRIHPDVDRRRAVFSDPWRRRDLARPLLAQARILNHRPRGVSAGNSALSSPAMLPGDDEGSRPGPWDAISSLADSSSAEFLLAGNKSDD